MSDPAELTAAIDAARQVIFAGMLPAQAAEEAVRAAWPIAEEYFSDQAADRIARHGAPSNPAGAAQWDRDMRLAQNLPSTSSRCDAAKP